MSVHYQMFNKTELKIIGIILHGTNLHSIADCVAEVCGFTREKVLVIDVRNEEVALDVLEHDIDPRTFMGKEKTLLSHLKQIPGVELRPDAKVVSDGMLGWIAFDASEEEILESIDRAEQMSQDMMSNIMKRVLVYPSGTELLNGEIEDTNTPMLIKALNEAGFEAEAGRILEDDENDIISMLYKGINEGYGTIITTGGVGAEDKDHSVESVQYLDKTAAAPYIAKFHQGHGRHKKDGIRISVGQVDHVKLITLPGPNDEVSACIPVLISGLKKRQTKEELADALAATLRRRLEEKYSHLHNHEEQK